MAWRMKLKLPKFKVTQIGDTTTHRRLPRGRKEVESHLTTENLSPSYNPDVSPDFCLEQSLPDSADNSHIEKDASTSLYAIKQKACTSAWEQIRAGLRNTIVEGSAMPANQCCMRCSDFATHRCTFCGSWAYYCSVCFESAHSVTNFFHVGEVWMVSFTDIR